MDIKIAWYEKLQKWIRTLGIYEEMQKERPRDMELMIGTALTHNAVYCLVLRVTLLQAVCVASVT